MPEPVKGADANAKVPAKKKQQQMIWWIAGGAGLVLILVIWFTNRSASNAASGTETASTEGGTGIAGTLAALESAGVLGGSAAGGSVGVTGPAGNVGATGPRGATGPSGATGKSGGIVWTKAQETKAWGAKRSKSELGKLFVGGKWYSGVPKPALSSSPYAAGGTYTVRPGDSIQGIANRFRIPGGWENLYHINQGTIGAHPVIYPGMRLKI